MSNVTSITTQEQPMRPWVRWTAAIVAALACVCVPLLVCAFVVWLVSLYALASWLVGFVLVTLLAIRLERELKKTNA